MPVVLQTTTTYSPDSESPPPSAATLTDYTTTTTVSTSSLERYPQSSSSLKKASTTSSSTNMNGGADFASSSWRGSDVSGGGSEIWTKIEQEKQRQDQIRNKLKSPKSIGEGLARYGSLPGGGDGAQSAVSMPPDLNRAESAPQSSHPSSPRHSSRRKSSRSHRHHSTSNRSKDDGPTRKVSSHPDMKALAKEVMLNGTGGSSYRGGDDDDDLVTNVTAPTILHQQHSPLGRSSMKSSKNSNATANSSNNRHHHHHHSKSPRTPSGRKLSVSNKSLESPKPTLPQAPDLDMAIRSAPAATHHRSSSDKHHRRRHGSSRSKFAGSSQSNFTNDDGDIVGKDGDDENKPSRSSSRRRRSSSPNKRRSPSRSTSPGKPRLPAPPSPPKLGHDSNTSLADDIVNSDDNDETLLKSNDGSGLILNEDTENDGNHRKLSPRASVVSSRRRASQEQIESLMDEAFQSPGTRGYHQHKRRLSKSPNSIKDRSSSEQPPSAPNLSGDSPPPMATRKPQSILSPGKKKRTIGLGQHITNNSSEEDDDEVRSLRSKKSIVKISDEPPEVRERSEDFKTPRPNSLREMSMKNAPRANSFSNHSVSGRSWGSKRVIQKEDIIKTEWWVYAVASVLLSITTVGLGYVVLIIFGANGSREPVYDQLLEAVALLSPSNPDIAELDEHSPQRLALEWLVNEDEHFHTYKNQAIVVDDSTIPRLKARYALAVLYFSTTTETQSDDGIDSDSPYSLTIGGWSRRYKFLSSRHECEWNSVDDSNSTVVFGVTCDEETQQNVVSLNLSNNNLRGRLPEELMGLISLQELDLSGNVLTGTIPIWPSFFGPTLLKLNIANNYLTGTLPVSFGNYLYSLEELDISHNMISSTIPTSVGLMTNLKSFHVAENNMNGTIPDSAIFFNGGWNQLAEFNVAMNDFSGNIDFVPRVFSQETMLYLNISHNNFDATIPRDISRLTRLKVMDISHNRMKGSLPFDLGNMDSLGKVYCGSNMISGEFPWNSFGGVASLTDVDAPHNLLRGDVFLDDMSRFSKTLRRVNFHGNHLSGNIPNTIGTMINLSYLDIGDNDRIGGSLPAVLGLLTSLSYLDLGGNSFESTVPFQLGNLASLKSLYIQDNEFVGQLPNELNRLTMLGHLELQSNQLTGNIDFLCGVDSLTNIVADCLSSTFVQRGPPIGCSCCTVCL